MSELPPDSMPVILSDADSPRRPGETEDDYMARRTAEAPPLSPEHLARLRVIFSGPAS
jgi:hypothetical protein